MMSRVAARSITILAMLLTVGWHAQPAAATWSICIADQDTNEVAVGTVTCLNSFDLLAIVPVVVVEKGTAAVQSAGDFKGVRRPIIFEELARGTHPDAILELMAGISGHQNRQYGIADVEHRAVSFTGSANGGWAGGRTFEIGSRIYAIQGNVLAGACVINGIEDAIRATMGDIPDQLMAGMEAAAATGGDGRCSCSAGAPEACGCPVPVFDKSGHIGGMVVARVGDIDDPVCNASGCADGDYFMRFNVAFQGSGEPDPVLQLRAQFDQWRAEHLGRPDAMTSTVTFDTEGMRPDGVSETTMVITLRDWQDGAASADGLLVDHDDDSAGITSIGAIEDQGGGVFHVQLTAGTMSGIDRFRVTADDGVRPVVLTPSSTFATYPAGDLTFDGVVNFADILTILAMWGPCIPDVFCPADANGDGSADFADILVVLANWTSDGACCFDDGSCTIGSSFECLLAGGSYLGADTDCTDACPIGACCLPTGACRGVPEARCIALGGLFQGDGTMCVGTGCDNDDCANALLVGEGSFAYSTEGSTTDGPSSVPPMCDEGGGTTFVKDVWFRYDATSDGTLSVGTCDSTFDNRIAVYEATACPGELVACSDDACGDGGTRGETTARVTAGASYLIRIGTPGGTLGSGTLTVNQR